MYSYSGTRGLHRGEMTPARGSARFRHGQGYVKQGISRAQKRRYCQRVNYLLVRKADYTEKKKQVLFGKVEHVCAACNVVYNPFNRLNSQLK